MKVPSLQTLATNAALGAQAPLQRSFIKKLIAHGYFKGEVRELVEFLYRCTGISVNGHADLAERGLILIPNFDPTTKELNIRSLYREGEDDEAIVDPEFYLNVALDGNITGARTCRPSATLRSPLTTQSPPPHSTVEKRGICTYSVQNIRDGDGDQFVNILCLTPGHHCAVTVNIASWLCEEMEEEERRCASSKRTREEEEEEEEHTRKRRRPCAETTA